MAITTTIITIIITAWLCGCDRIIRTIITTTTTTIIITTTKVAASGRPFRTPACYLSSILPV
ncbi:MAG: hypothetical protein WA776_00675 [Xanthobacteraceae bacterium]